jgi:hypothetical protein
MSAPYLLATTTQTTWLLDPASGKVRCLDTGRGVYYGITFTSETIFIACRQAPVGADRSSQNNIILCFDRNLQPLAELRGRWPIRDVHQIFQYEGTLYICSTFDDCIMEYSLAHQTWDRWFPFGDHGEARDVHHMNSIFVDKQGFLLAGTQPEGWFARFDCNKRLCGTGKHSLGVATHNVWRAGGDISVCSSNESAIVSRSGNFQKPYERGWLRGVAQLGSCLFVGISQNLVRDVRATSDCMIARLEADGSPSRVYSFRGMGMLHDIRTLNVPDETHNGVVFQWHGTISQHDALVCCTDPDAIGL